MRRKVIFGIPSIIVLCGVGIFMIQQGFSMAPIIFVFAFSGGIGYWLVINYRESLKRRDENFRRKNK